MDWAKRTLRAAASGFSVLGAGALVARLPDLGPWTLGLLTGRFASVILAGAAATFFGVLLWGRRGGALGSAAVLLFTYVLDADITRRRSALFAALCLALPWILHAALDRRKERTLPWILCLVGASAGAGTLAASDRLPYRTGLPPIDASAPPPGAPHIVLITMDTTRYDAVLGPGSRERAPSLHRFAESALRFPHAVAEASHTHPSMASLLTSRLPIEHGSISTSPAIDPALPTLAQHLRRAGYRTAGFLENPWLGPDFGLAAGYEYLHKKAELTRIEAWLQKSPSAPVFLHVHLFEPHGPYELRRPYLPRDAPSPWTDSAKRLGDTISAQFIQSGEVPGAHGLGPEDFAWLRQVYLTEVAAMDRWIGEFLDLAERTLRGPTIFAITADHGEEFGDHGALHHGHTLYGELVHVPLLLRVPGTAPATSGQVAGLVDIAPTLLEAAGLAPLPGAAGRSLLTQGPEPPRVSTRFFRANQHLFAIQIGEWKLHLAIPATAEWAREPIDFEAAALPASVELYRWRSDARELENVAPLYPDVVTDLQQELRAWHVNALSRSLNDEAGNENHTPRTPSQATYEELRSLGYSAPEAPPK